MQLVFVIISTAFAIYASHAFGAFFSQKARRSVASAIFFWLFFLGVLGALAFPNLFEATIQKIFPEGLNQESTWLPEGSSHLHTKIRILVIVAMVSTLAGYLHRSALLRATWAPFLAFGLLGAIFSYTLASMFLGGSGPYISALISAVLLGSYTYWR